MCTQVFPNDWTRRPGQPVYDPVPPTQCHEHSEFTRTGIAFRGDLALSSSTKCAALQRHSF